MSDDRTGLADELRTLVDRRLVDPLEILLDSPELLTLLREHVAAQVGEWAHDLLGHDPAAAMSTASRLLAALRDEPLPAEEVLSTVIWRDSTGPAPA